MNSPDNIPQIILFEPATFLTDMLLGSLCVYFWYRTKRFNNAFWWKLFFLTLGLSAFAGGFVHGFYPTRQLMAGLFLWLTSQSLTMISVFFLQVATIQMYGLPLKCKRFLSVICILQLIYILYSIFHLQNYKVVLIGMAATCLPVLILNITMALDGRKEFWPFCKGLLICMSTAFIWMFKLRISIWINHNDISHLILLVGLHYIFKGVLLLRLGQTGSPTFNTIN